MLMKNVGDKIILVHLHLVELDQKWVFKQFENGPKVGVFEQISHLISNYEEKILYIAVILPRNTKYGLFNEILG